MPTPARRSWLDRVKSAVPTREQIEGVRWLRPVAHRVLAPELWRFTRRSVPRGVALGVIVGILVPVAQTPVSALLAFPFRANIPVAAATTFLTNPLTTPPIWVAAYWVGRWILRLDAQVPGSPISTSMAADASFLDWLLVEAGPATATGLVTLAFGGAIVGYGLAVLGWRLWIVRKWRRGRRRVLAARASG